METSQELFRALGMTLIHSIWQGAIIAATVMLILIFSGRNNSRMRYAVHFTGLLALLASFIITFIIVLRNNQALKEFQQAVLTLPQGNDLLKALPVNNKGLFAAVLDILEPFSTWFAIFWLAGFIVTGVKMTGGAITARLTFRRNLIHPDEYLTDIFNSLKRTMGIPAGIKLRISAGMISPMVTGFFVPLVIVPAAAITGLSSEQLRAVLIHELAHIRRYDHLLIVIQAFARLILFFHPLAWYFFREIDRERENCCDDFVVKINDNPINYIKALAMIQEMNLPEATANAFAGRRNQLLSRIKRLLKPHTKYTTAFRLSVITMAVLIFGAISMAFVITEKPDLKRSFPVNKADAQMKQQKELTAAVVQNKKDGDKKKMVIIFNNDTIKEITVNGKKLTREEMKQYAEDIRKVQRELEFSQQELRMVNRELEEAQRQMEMAHKELQMNNLNEQLNRELALKNFNFELYNQKWNNQEFRDQMKKLQEEAMNAMNKGQHSLDYLNSEEYKKQMEKAQEVWREAFEKNKELFNSDEFREQMRKAAEESRKAFEELSKSGKFDKDFQYHFRFDGSGMPPVPPVPDFNFQEPPEAPEADTEMDEYPELPELPEVPEFEVDIDTDEHLEAPESAATGSDGAKSDARPEELDKKLRELEQE